MAKRRSHPSTLRAQGLRLLLLAGLCAFSGPPASAAGITALAHPQVQSDWLNRDFLRAAFTMRVRVWPGGAPITVFVLRDADPLHEAFCREVLGTYPYVLRRTWEQMVFTGTGVQPRRVDSLEEMEMQVRSTPGAVGYIWIPAEDADEPAGGRP